MFDPLIEIKLSRERVRLIIQDCVYRYPTNQEKAVVFIQQGNTV